MRAKSATKENTSLGITPKAPWRLTQVKLLTGYKFEVHFVDGINGCVDMTRLIMSEKAGIFSTLKDKNLFKQVYLEHGAITWPGEIDLAPDAMYDEIKQKGTWVL